MEHSSSVDFLGPLMLTFNFVPFVLILSPPVSSDPELSFDWSVAPHKMSGNLTYTQCYARAVESYAIPVASSWLTSPRWDLISALAIPPSQNYVGESDCASPKWDIQSKKHRHFRCRRLPRGSGDQQ